MRDTFLLIEGWQKPNLHNGYITTFVEGGIIGSLLLLIFVLSLVNFFIKSKNHIRTSFFASVFLIFIIRNFFEDSMIRSTDIVVFFLWISIFLLHPSRDLIDETDDY